jgi:hypothetical protein
VDRCCCAVGRLLLALPAQADTCEGKLPPGSTFSGVVHHVEDSDVCFGPAGDQACWIEVRLDDSTPPTARWQVALLPIAAEAFR